MDVIDQSRLQEQVSSGQQVITDQVLIGSNSDSVTHTQRAEDVQDLSTRSHKPSSFDTGFPKNTTGHRGAELDAIRGSHDLDDHVTQESEATH